MPLQVQPWEDQDFDIYPELVYQAFKDDLLQPLYPNGFSEEDRKHTARSSREKHQKRGDSSVWIKTVDTDLPANDTCRQIVGAAHYQFYPTERSEAELDEEQKEGEKEPSPPGLNEAFAEEFFGACSRLRRETFGGKPYVLLHMLVVRPSHHRRGIGGILLDWGNKQADEMKLSLYLEASPMGRPLYERYGYEKVGEIELDVRAHGHPKDLPHTCMLRPAKAGGSA